MRALLYTEDEDTPLGMHIDFYFDPFDIKGYYIPFNIDGNNCFNILINGAFLTVVETAELKDYLSKVFKY